MPTITLTATRQATFPKEACEALGLQPGDVLDLEPRDGVQGREWVLRPRPARARRWVGTLARYGTGVADHSMAAIRASIARGRMQASPPS